MGSELPIFNREEGRVATAVAIVLSREVGDDRQSQEMRAPIVNGGGRGKEERVTPLVVREGGSRGNGD